MCSDYKVNHHLHTDLMLGIDLKEDFIQLYREVSFSKLCYYLHKSSLIAPGH